MTLLGHARLVEELKHLKSVERHAIIKAIATAREHGDLSENAEYHAAREKQSFIEGRIAELDDKTGRAEIIDPSKLSGSKITFGASIKIYDVQNDCEVDYQIVGELEANVNEGRLSISSPLARALLGKAKDDYFEFKSPSGKQEYEIIAVEYK